LPGFQHDKLTEDIEEVEKVRRVFRKPVIRLDTVEG